MRSQVKQKHTTRRKESHEARPNTTSSWLCDDGNPAPFPFWSSHLVRLSLSLFTMVQSCIQFAPEFESISPWQHAPDFYRFALAVFSSHILLHRFRISRYRQDVAFLCPLIWQGLFTFHHHISCI